MTLIDRLLNGLGANLRVAVLAPILLMIGGTGLFTSHTLRDLALSVGAILGAVFLLALAYIAGTPSQGPSTGGRDSNAG